MLCNHDKKCRAGVYRDGKCRAHWRAANLHHDTMDEIDYEPRDGIRNDVTAEIR